MKVLKVNTFMKHLPLIVGIALPIVFIAMVMLFAFLPNLSINPEYDFIYSSHAGSYYNNTAYKHSYELIDGKLTLKPIIRIAENTYPNQEIHDAPLLYRYDAENNAVYAITFEEAQSLYLTPGPSSPDGYGLEYKYGHDGIFELFGSSGTDAGYFLVKGRGSKKLPSLTSHNYYSNSINLIGWVK